MRVEMNHPLHLCLVQALCRLQMEKARAREKVKEKDKTKKEETEKEDRTKKEVTETLLTTLRKMKVTRMPMTKMTDEDIERQKQKRRCR